MNFDLPFIPERTVRPRTSGLTMMMDKGLGLREAEHFVEANIDYTDIVKFGFGTALKKKLSYTEIMVSNLILEEHFLKFFMQEVSLKIS